MIDLSESSCRFHTKPAVQRKYERHLSDSADLPSHIIYRLTVNIV